MRLSIVIPAFNERRTLPLVIERVQHALDGPFFRASGLEGEIVVVDDGSTDGTREWLRQAEAARLQVVLRSRNGGKGAALEDGLRRAHGDVVLIQDADLEYDPRDYPALLAPILEGDADVVFGSRFLGGTHRVLYYWHSVANRIVTTLSNMLTNLNLSDVEVGYKVFSRSALAGIHIESKRFGCEPELVAKIAARRLRVYEVPIRYRGRTYAEGKKIGLLDALEALWVILRFGARSWLRSPAAPAAAGEALAAGPVAAPPEQPVELPARPALPGLALEPALQAHRDSAPGR
jgi:glycosyltransferase involved in cell wall biosynthesis